MLTNICATQPILTMALHEGARLHRWLALLLWAMTVGMFSFLQPHSRTIASFLTTDMRCFSGNGYTPVSGGARGGGRR